MRRSRLGIIVVDDGLYTHRWVAPLLDRERHDPCFVSCLSPFHAKNLNPGGAKGLLPVSLRRLRYYGLRATGHFALRAALSSAGDLLSARGRLGSGRPGSVESCARARGVPLLAVPDHDVNRREYVAAVAAHEPDLLVCAFSQIASRALLAVPRKGCLNVHFSRLPLHRGREPLFYAMLTGEGAGVSVHWMTSAIDGGAVVAQRGFVPRHHTLHEVILQACETASEVVPEAVEQAMVWRGSRASSDPLLPMNKWPGRTEVVAFLSKGLRFI